MNHAHRLLQRQRPARPGGGYFADAVATDGDRPHPAALESAGQGDLDCEQRRLRDLGQVEAIGGGRRVEFGENGLTAAFRIRLVNLDQRLAKYRIVLEQLQAHAGPLRAVA